MAAAAREDPAFLVGKAITSKPGQPMPYDPKLGLSRAEYDEFLRLSQEVRFGKVSEAVLTISSDNAGTLTLQFPGANNSDGIVKLNLNDLSVVTPFGTVAKPTEVTAGQNVGATGRWNGYVWRSGASSLITGKSVRLYVGQIEETREVYLGYDVKSTLTREAAIDITLYLPAPTELPAVDKNSAKR
jgi:hypothetical protein